MNMNRTLVMKRTATKERAQNLNELVMEDRKHHQRQASKLPNRTTANPNSQSREKECTGAKQLQNVRALTGLEHTGAEKESAMNLQEIEVVKQAPKSE